MTDETKLKNKCIEYLKEKDIYYIKVHGGGWGAKGTPDLITCINGAFVAFELKVIGNKPQKDQIIQMKRIEKSKGKAFVIYDIDTFKRVIEMFI